MTSIVGINRTTRRESAHSIGIDITAKRMCGLDFPDGVEHLVAHEG